MSQCVRYLKETIHVYYNVNETGIKQVGRTDRVKSTYLSERRVMKQR